MDAPPFVHLHCHSHFSLLDGAAPIKGLVERAKGLGMSALALTDHGNLYGALDFYTVPPCRLLDTRTGTPMSSGMVRSFTLAGNCGISATARAVAVNLSLVNPGGQGFLKIYPHGAPVPVTSALNVNPGGTRTNNAVIPLAGGGADALLSLAGGASADLVIDVVGYFE